MSIWAHSHGLAQPESHPIRPAMGFIWARIWAFEMGSGLKKINLIHMWRPVNQSHRHGIDLGWAHMCMLPGQGLM